MFTRRSFLNLIPAAIAGAALAKKCFGNIVTGEGQAVSTPQLPVPDGSLSFEALRKLAEHPYVRECIAETKYMITWNWHATYGTGSRRGTSEDVFWPGILEHTLEDMLVGDNASLVNCSKLGPRWMIAIAGDRVTRMADQKDWTTAPMPPNPAYQVTEQWAVGGFEIASYYTTDDLIYAPRNIVPRGWPGSHLYGVSPLEEVATIVQRLNDETQRWAQNAADKIRIQEAFGLRDTPKSRERMESFVTWLQDLRKQVDARMA